MLRHYGSAACVVGMPSVGGPSAAHVVGGGSGGSAPNVHGDPPSPTHASDRRGKRPYWKAKEKAAESIAAGLYHVGSTSSCNDAESKTTAGKAALWWKM
jgi:hypothetical protein